ncbi:MAG: hypothetical protein QOE44_3022 [Solirubrobacteraceae bacterium]|nr:hypothetical protein [Solirubrobacteraceae bacterium]
MVPLRPPVGRAGTIPRAAPVRKVLPVARTVVVGPGPGGPVVMGVVVDLGGPVADVARRVVGPLAGLDGGGQGQRGDGGEAEQGLGGA